LHDYTSVRDIFQKGGLILVRQGQEPVCGMICEISGDTCIAKQMGVMDGRFDLVKAGAEVALWWFMLDWAREQGAKNFNFGASWALTTNGTFNFKRQWGTRVRKFEAMHARWNFLAQSLPARLVDHLNTQGLITEYQNGFFSTVFLNPGESITGDKLADQRKRAAVFGLDNILAIAPDGNRYFLPDSVDELH
jgi:hypothetical protein